jgi:DNA-binding NarL/FixJ family response regulator
MVQTIDKIKVIIVDDHDFFRLGLKTAIQTNHPEIVVANEAKNGKEFFALLKITPVELVLLDILLPDMNGIEIARRLKTEYPQIKILVISSETSTSTIEELLNIGIDGFISKFDSSMDTFAEAICAIMQGLEYYGKDISQIISRIYLCKKKTQQVTPEFSEQEKRVIECCHEGFTGKEIANYLNITYKTMEWHKANIFAKLGIHSTVELVHFAVKNGIIRG